MALKDAVKKGSAFRTDADSLDARVVRSGNVITIELPAGAGRDVPSFASATMSVQKIGPVLSALKDSGK